MRTEVVEHVFVNKEERDLKGTFYPSREWYLPGAHSDSLGNWVKQPNLARMLEDGERKPRFRHILEEAAR